MEIEIGGESSSTAMLAVKSPVRKETQELREEGGRLKEENERLRTELAQLRATNDSTGLELTAVEEA